MAREITTHKVNGLNEALTLEVTDEPGQGGANHAYLVSWPQQNPYIPEESVPYHCYIKFQQGPIQEAGVNGLSNEVLLAIVIDRLEGFQSGAYACDSNARALQSVENALFELHARTLERTTRGVEGTSQV